MNHLNIDQSKIIEALMSGIGLGIIVTDTTGEALLFNDAATEILGEKWQNISPEEWPERYGIYLADGVSLCPPEQSPLLRALRGEKLNNIEVVVFRPGQSRRRWCMINHLPLQNGVLQGAVLVIQDITERKNLADEVVRSNEALQQFASVAAHDLQEPLRSVSGFVDILEEELSEQLNENSRHYMTRIKTATMHMHDLIKDLLAFSRIQSRPNVPRLVDCNEIVQRCIENVTASIERTGATVRVDVLPTFVADAPQLSQLFQNLLGNALKFNAKGRPLDVHVGAIKQGPLWLFSVTDNGIGMDMQFAERVFVLFQRLHPQNEYSGTGIGLAICKRIVEGHGGDIWVESKEGKGSTFSFTIQPAPGPKEINA